jgi:hypothetical protein
MKLLPNDNATTFETWLTETHPLFGDPKQFIRAYNSGMINTNNEDVRGIATRLENAYRNVSVANGSISILPEDFVLTRELITELEQLQLWIELREAATSTLKHAADGTILILEDKKLKKFSTLSDTGAVEQLDSSAVLPRFSQSYIHNLPNTVFTTLENEEGTTVYSVDTETLKNFDTSVVYRLSQVTTDTTPRY